MKIGTRGGVRAGAAVLLLATLALGGAIWWHRPAYVDPRRAYRDALTTLANGNYSAARYHAERARAAAPGVAAPLVMLAQADLQLGEGLAAEAALSRAGEAGMPPAALHAYRAQARFLQGDYTGALDEAARAPAGDPLAIRVRARALAVQGQADQAVALLAALVAGQPQNGAAWIDLGRVRLAAGDVGGATQAAGEALRLRPGDPIALTLQGELVRARYGLAAALPWFAAALHRDAYFVPALIEYAATLGEIGRYADMLAATRKVLAAQPGSPQALYLQAVLAARAGRIELARTLLDRGGPALHAIPGALLLGGNLALAGGKDEGAVRSWRMLVGAQPTNVAARRLLATALLRAGDIQGALDAVRPMALRGDADSYTLTLAARAFEASGDRVMAARFLDRAAASATAVSVPFATDEPVAALLADAAAAPNDPNYLLGLIRGLIAAGDTAGAVVRARGLVMAAPGAPAAHLALGDALAAGGRYRDAVAAYARAADLTFDEPTMLRLVDAQGRIGRPGDAAATLALYLAQNPQSLPARRLLGHWQVANGQADAGIEVLEGVRRVIGDRDAGVLADLALGYAATGDGAIARRYGRAADRLAPMNAAVADAYGIALAADQDVSGARQLLAKATALNPTDPAIAAHRHQIER